MSAAVQPESSPSSRADQARERRRQFVAIAAALIEEEGVDAVTLPRVTERAGCARTLIYCYFASREDLLIGVIDDYYERLDARLTESDQRVAIEDALAGGERRDLGPARRLAERFFDIERTEGLGGAILRTTPLLSPRLKASIDAACERHERRFTRPLCASGLSEAEARTAVDAMNASFVRLALRARDGELRREEAIDLHTRATVGLIRGLLDESA